jgi:hypothetical protein
LDDVEQWPLESQHPAQTPPPHEQAPLEQDCPLAHCPHAAPPVPHEPDD